MLFTPERKRPSSMELAFSVSTAVEHRSEGAVTYQMMDVFKLATTTCSGIEPTPRSRVSSTPLYGGAPPHSQGSLWGSRTVFFVQ